MRMFLVWTLFSGGWAVTGPTEVTAKQGGLLAVSCSYESGYELYPKYWCRPGFLWICFTYIAQTNGSEVTVTQDRVSIEDKHTEHSFTVTLDNVSLGDTGWYSCGVRRRLWFNLQHSTEVTVSTDLPTTTEGSNVSPLGTNRLCAKDCEESPALSQLSITPLLLFLSVKAAVALALVCQVVWVRSRHRSHDKENVKLIYCLMGLKGFVFLGLASVIHRGAVLRTAPGDLVAKVVETGQSLNMFPSPHSTRDHHVARSRTGLREEMVPGFWWRERDKGEQCLVLALLAMTGAVLWVSLRSG
ncbi:hypothetical protein AV530_003143 [Patagioenas fasciata monilis]|uniref:Ig-like domain-containing protein n=1 Tax=Patagioenas fasciata monilis TaxID=372326 RepID=A0A1V4KVV8_PATFA|nr:hypothetical protein AV530_003143 [Patagioenas fasciata monilis]